MNLRNEFRMPEWAANWKTFLIFATISFAFAFALRCLDLPKWDTPSCSVAGEYIMGTHDAYYWLAGAKGVGSAVDNPMSELVRSLGAMTGAKYGNIAFWLPAVFAGFTAVAAFGWGMLVAGPWVGLVGAVYATSVPAFFYRTRLSYYDTDIITLFFPLLISLLLARWLLSASRRSWLPVKTAEKRLFSPAAIDYSLPLAAGFLTSYGSLWHGDVLSYGMVVFIMATFLAIFLSEGKDRVFLLRGMTIFVASAFFGLIGFFVSLLLIVLFRSEIIEKYPWLGKSRFYFILLGCLFAVGVGDSLYTVVAGKIAAYLKPTAEEAVGNTPIYPGIAQSVIEAQNIKMSVLYETLTGSGALVWLGFAGFFFLIAMRPMALILLPFGLVTFAAVKLGGRFSMFGGIAIGTGISFIFYFLIEKYVRSSSGKWLKPFQAFCIIGALLFQMYPGFMNLVPTPIMGPAHAKALIEVGKETPKDSTFWTWWDWGYATMYYAGRHSFADGGHHGGKVLFPLAFSYATPSPLQSAQLIKYSAANKNNPAKSWAKMSADDVTSLLGKLGQRRFRFPEIPDQYFVITWNDVRLSYWILYYGSWDIKNGSGIHPMVSALVKPFDFDSSEGIISIRGEKPFRVSSYDFLDKRQLVGDSFSRANGPHLLYNKQVSQGFLVDDFTYQSLLMKLLIGDPSNSSLSNSFQLVYEGFPMVRVYKVL